MTTRSLSWYSTLLWRCLASTLGWTCCSCRLNRFSSATLLCWSDTGTSAAWDFAFSCCTFRARSIALSRGFSLVSEPGACLAAVLWPRLWDGVCGHRWQLLRGLTREMRALKPELQSPVQAALLQMFMVVDMRNVPELRGNMLRSPLNHIRVEPFKITAKKKHKLCYSRFEQYRFVLIPHKTGICCPNIYIYIYLMEILKVKWYRLIFIHITNTTNIKYAEFLYASLYKLYLQTCFNHRLYGFNTLHTP